MWEFYARDFLTPEQKENEEAGILSARPPTGGMKHDRTPRLSDAKMSILAALPRQNALRAEYGVGVTGREIKAKTQPMWVPAHAQYDGWDGLFCIRQWLRICGDKMRRRLASYTAAKKLV